MSEAILTTVYADINCPFCYALHERLNHLGLIDNVEWRPIEHAPGELGDGKSPKKIELLNEEYALLSQRAPDVNCENPQLVPNTKLINRYLVAVAHQFPEQSNDFRRKMYQALWIHKQDLEDESIIKGYLSELDIALVHINDDYADEDYADELRTWQNEWQYGDFDSRIPAMIRKDNELLLGLQSTETLKNFVENRDYQEDLGNTTCQYFVESEIYLLSIDNQTELSQAILTNNSYKLTHFKNIHSLLIQFVDAQPGLIILDTSDPNVLAHCQQLKNANAATNVPVMFVSCNGSRELESKIFELGGADFVSLPQQSDAFLARIKWHVRNKQKLDLLTEHASKDPLTGLNNRREFDVHLERAWRRACRYKLNLGLIFMDIDYFKQYNDLYGHLKGDDALIQVASAINESLYRSEDFAARYGGEEFVVVLPGLDEENLITVAQRIKSNIAKLNIQHCYNNAEGMLTLSVGVCLTKANADNHSKMMLKAADEALYEAKKSGRDKVVVKKL